MEIRVNTDQIKLLEDFFADLSTADQRKIFLAAFRRGSKPIISEAQVMVPKRTGNLQRSIGTMPLQDEVALLIGARKGGGQKGWHGHFVENGTTERFYRTKKGKTKSTGKMPASHFFEGAYDRNEEKMVDAIQDEWLSEIDRLIQRLNRDKR